MSKKEKAKTKAKKLPNNITEVDTEKIDFTKSVTIDFHLSYLYGLHQIYVDEILSYNNEEPGAATEAFVNFTEYIKEKDPTKQAEIAKDWPSDAKKLFCLFMLINLVTQKAKEEGHIITEKQMMDKKFIEDWSKSLHEGDESAAMEVAHKMMNQIYDPSESS